MITYEKDGDIVKKIETKIEVYSISEIEKEIKDLEDAIDNIKPIDYTKDANSDIRRAIDLRNKELFREKQILEEGELLQAKQLLKELNGS